MNGAIDRSRTGRLLGGAAVLLHVCLSLACDKEPPVVEEWVSIDVSLELNLRAGELSVAPEVASRIEATGSGFAVRLPWNNPSPVTITAPGACPIVINRAAPPERAKLAPWLSFPRHINDAGYGTTVEFAVRPGCEAAKATPIGWSKAHGTLGAPLRVTDDGRTVSVTLPKHADVVEKVPWGIVPLSPRTRGEVALDGEYQDGTRRPWRVRVVVGAAPRATGVPSVSVGHRLRLGGDGWRVSAHPSGGKAVVERDEHGASFVPDAPGVWRLVDADERTLSLTAGHLGDTPLDCTRSDCHADLATAPITPMTTILQRGLTGALGPDYDPMCAIACHATGEPGIDDTGFVPTLAAFGNPLPRGDRAWEHLPRSLRRLGGVGCVACHGTATIPEPDARWSILRNDVCATCHDLPPEYAHVVAYRESRMARSDVDPATRDVERGCARCHTTSGFLVSLGSLESHRTPPDGVGALGIGCAACHAVHEHGGAPARTALLRDVPPPAWLSSTATSVALSEPRTRVCVACHAPNPANLDASASAAALWAGRGGVAPESGEDMSGAAPHGTIDGGCMGCHQSGPELLGRGRSHSFSVDTGRCAECHTERRADDAIRRRALELLDGAGASEARLGGSPLHARNTEADKNVTRARALYDLLLIIEDPAAAIHNAAYARELLRAAERALASSGSKAGAPP